MGKYDDDLMDDEDFSSNMLEQYSTYEKIEVKEIATSLHTKATNLIAGISRVYTSVGLSVDEEFIDSIKSIETDALVSMLKQVKYAEHMVDSLMNRLDNGGFADKEIYEQIKSMQHHVIQMNLEVSKYTRLLPEFFKFTDTDISSISQQQKSSQTKVNNYSEAIEDAQVVQKQIPLNAPQFGTKDFLASIDIEIDSMTNIEAILSSEPEEDLGFDPADIFDNEDQDDDE